MHEPIAEAFVRSYGFADGVRYFRAPGRVNLIGEHTDYNDGFVLPVAIDREVTIAARARDDRRVRVHSVNFGEDGEFDLDNSHPIKHGYWLNFIEGTARVLEKHGHRLVGADIVIDSSVPVGGGLSSSAAVETATAYTMLSLARIAVDRKQMALACQQAEHEYSGANVGVMDQYISALGEDQRALLIDCRSLESTPVFIDSSDYKLIVCNTGVKHDLGTSAYNDRRRECEDAAKILRPSDPHPSLRDVSMRDLQVNRHLLSDVLYKRAHHVVTENARVIAAVEALHDKDFDRLGRLMYQSHESLRNDYEVSCIELDTIVDASHEIPGVAGTRMTGGGFGGCTISFVQSERVGEFKKRMTAMYRKRFGLDLTIYDCEIVRGAEEIVL
jgi:galactokinase